MPSGQTPVVSRIDPPFRADHVGSLLRPPAVHEARAARAAGTITPEQLRAVEDDAIATAVREVEALGMRSVTDGEFRRAWFHLDFLEQLDGVAVTGNIAASSDAASTVHMTPPKLSVVGPLRHVHDIQVADYRYLASVTTQTPKVSIPSPTMVHFRGGVPPSTSPPTPTSRSSSPTSRRATGPRSPPSTPPGAGTCSSTTPTWRTSATP